MLDPSLLLILRLLLLLKLVLLLLAMRLDQGAAALVLAHAVLGLIAGLGSAPV